MILYTLVLYVHSYVRWAVVALAVTALVRSFRAWRAAGPWTESHEKIHVALVGIVDLQLLLGLSLYLFLSPITHAFFAAPGASMKNSVLRFFGVEHIFGMLFALAIIHIARIRSKKSADSKLRHRRVWTSTAFAFFVIIVSIPWPDRPAARPMFRLPEEHHHSHTPVASHDPEPCTPLYAARCVACHGEQGHGDGIASAALNPRPRNFADPSWGAGRSDEQLRQVIHEGGAQHGLSPAMPAQSDLSNDDLSALVRCVRMLHQQGQ